MPIQEYVTLVEKVKLNDFAWSFTLESSMKMTEEMSFGQFVHISCGEGHLLRRPISICDWQEGLFRIVFEVRGEGTLWLAQRRPGEQLDVLGPLGHGFQNVKGQKLLLVGGGIGVPPVLACARGSGAGSAAVLGFRDAKHAMLQEEFRESCSQVIVTTDDGSLGEHGYADAAVARLLEQDRSYQAVLACGPKPMLKAVARVAADFGVPCQVSLEERMGCGVGACLVCACQIKDGEEVRHRHVCKDGPVFPAEEVIWDD